MKVNYAISVPYPLFYPRQIYSTLIQVIVYFSDIIKLVENLEQSHRLYFSLILMLLWSLIQWEASTIST